MGSVSPEVLVARAYLCRVAEPANVPVWDLVRRLGPVQAAACIRRGEGLGDVDGPTRARRDKVEPHGDLEAAERHGLRFVVPESDDWPHFAFAALEATGLARVASWNAGNRSQSDSGELMPPLALWVRGTGDLRSLGVRSVGLVGARAATEYGQRIAADFGYGLAQRDFVVVSGGAYGIDAAAHRGALSGGGETVLVSAGGLDRPYPPSSAPLYASAAEQGLLISESPPGFAPARRRFLTRNRLIAALSTGTVVVEAARRSGAINTAEHTVGLGRPLLAVPGPVTSGASAGCHRLLRTERYGAHLVESVDDIVAIIGSARDVSVEEPKPPGAAASLRDRLDALDERSRRVFDGFPARRAVRPDELAALAGVPPLDVIRALPVLEVDGLVEAVADGYRIRREDQA